jgi:ATP-binding cassette subfamily B protein
MFSDSVFLIGNEETGPMTRKAVFDTISMLLLPVRLYLVKRIIDDIGSWGHPGAVASLLLSCLLLALLMAAAAFITSSSLLMHTRIYEIGTLQKEKAVVDKTARLTLRLTESPAVKDLRKRALLHSPENVFLQGTSFLLDILQIAILTGIVISTGYWLLMFVLIVFGSIQSLIYFRTDACLERFKKTQTASFRSADHIHSQMIGKEYAKEMRIFGIGSLLQRRWREYYLNACKLNE